MKLNCKYKTREQLLFGDDRAVVFLPQLDDNDPRDYCVTKRGKVYLLVGIHSECDKDLYVLVPYREGGLSNELDEPDWAKIEQDFEKLPNHDYIYV